MPSGARESQLFFGYIMANIFKDPFGHHYHYRAGLYNTDYTYLVPTGTGTYGVYKVHVM